MTDKFDAKASHAQEGDGAQAPVAAQPGDASAMKGRRRLIAAALLTPPLVVTLPSQYARAANPCHSLTQSLINSRKTHCH
jgi:hypothetical protein